MAVLIAPMVLRQLPPGATPATKLVLFGGILFGTVAADLDIALGYARNKNGFHVHGEFTHSLAAAMVFAVGFAGLAAMATSVGRGRALLAGFLAYSSHLLMDYLNHGRGIMLFWPVTSERFASPIRIFYGVRHSDLTDLSQHAITLSTELIFAAGVLVLALPLYRRRPAGIGV
jgi:membrane-bound metal-dependent hydrolase YbcI (DUF457 family)